MVKQVRGLEIFDRMGDLLLDPDIQASVGKNIASSTKTAMLAQRGLLGNTLETDLRESGKLIKKVGYTPAKIKMVKGVPVRTAGWVGPSSARRQDVSKRAHSSMGLLAIHMVAREKLDPLGTRQPILLLRLLCARTQEAVNYIIRHRMGLHKAFR